MAKHQQAKQLLAMKLQAAENEYLAKEAMYDEMTPPKREILDCNCPSCLLGFLTEKILATSDPEYALQTFVGDLSAIVKLKLNTVSAHGLN
jgi:hypothetical protein